MKKMMNFLMGSLIGSITGSLLVLLLAPESGEETRNQIKNYFQTIRMEVENAGREKRIELQEQLSTLRSGKV